MNNSSFGSRISGQVYKNWNGQRIIVDKNGGSLTIQGILELLHTVSFFTDRYLTAKFIPVMILISTYKPLQRSNTLTAV